MSSEQATHTYEGRCHCGAVRFRFRSETITEGRRCNCSICVRKGAVLSARYYEPGEFEREAPVGAHAGALTAMLGRWPRCSWPTVGSRHRR